uniref:Uncharacterized protein n=1 Tax=Rhizophagus irregularis (strain DAOM 181602 / DAOM 197198 / MUCL 43194) TaxID=747089 RepID=U9V7Y3_RHIID
MSETFSSASSSNYAKAPPSSKTINHYQIAISLDGRFVVTFDTVNLLIKVLKNTDYRPFVISKDNENETSSEDKPNVSNEITEKIACFKINNNLTIDQLYESESDSKIETKINTSSIDKNDIYKWSIDLSNLQKYPSGEYFIFIAVSRIEDKISRMDEVSQTDIKVSQTDDKVSQTDDKESQTDDKESQTDDKESQTDNKISRTDDKVSRTDVNNKINYKKKNVEKYDFNLNCHTVNMAQNTTVPLNLKKGTVIYRLKLNVKPKDKNKKKDFENSIYNIDYNYNLTYYHCECVSGIPRFIEDLESDFNDDEFNEILKKFLY